MVKKCTICDKTFTRQSSLKRHNKNFHTVSSSKPSAARRAEYACFDCKESFASRQYLQQHVRMEIRTTDFVLGGQG